MLAAIVICRRKVFDKRKCELRTSRLHVEGVLECGRGEGETEEVGNLVGDLVSSHKVEFHDSHQKGDLGSNAQRDLNGPRVFAGVCLECGDERKSEKLRIKLGKFIPSLYLRDQMCIAIISTRRRNPDIAEGTSTSGNLTAS